MTANLFFANDRDLMIEVSHGPYLVDHNVLLSGYWGENLGRVTDNTEMTDTQLAELLVNAWMNSPGHKANLLEEHYTSISIAYVHLGGYHIVVQNFFGE